MPDIINAPGQRSCFVIGPMKDAGDGDQARLRRLKREVLEPIFSELEAEGYPPTVVETPFEHLGGNIMGDILAAIDRADIVVADLTTENPNAFYELAIAHALGRATISVREADSPIVAFDVRAFRYFPINLNDEQYEQSRGTLRPVIRATLERLADWHHFENPVQGFYGRPLIAVQSAMGLAMGYFNNFVKPAVEALIEREPDGGFRYEVTVADADLPRDDREALRMVLVIPNQIRLATTNSVSRVRERLPKAMIAGRHRPFTAYAAEVGTPPRTTIFDIPTTISGTEDAIRRRARDSEMIDPSSAEWKRLEAQETERFARELARLIRLHPLNPAFDRHVDVVRFNPEDPPTDLKWLAELWGF